MVLRVRKLKQLNSILLGYYPTKKTSMVYMTADRIASLICEGVKKVHTAISAKDLSKHSGHLLQVWACILLEEGCKSPHYIHKQLCLLGDSFCMYLCNTRVIQGVHCKALQ
jgi:hypothetical protein